jgi:hypothetical protein
LYLDRLVEVAHLRFLQRSDAQPGPVDHEVGEQVLAREHAGDGLDVGG